MPMGIKNGVTGSLTAAVDGALAATRSHSYVGLSEEGRLAVLQSSGNRDAHVVLRGGEQTGPNYDAGSIHETSKRLYECNLPQRLLVDCSHHNSGKRAEKQPVIFRHVLQQFIEGNQEIRGLMLESHLLGGSQLFSSTPRYGISLTDPCLDWPSTHHLVEWSCHALSEASLPFEEISLTCEKRRSSEPICL